MNYRNSYVGENGKKYIITSHKKVFEEVPETHKEYDGMDYDGYDQAECDYGDYASDDCHNTCGCNGCDGHGCDGGCQCGKKKKKMYEIDRVLGVGSGNTIAEICIPLCPPAVEVFSCLATEKVIFDALIAKGGKVFINGRLFKSIPYRTKCGTWHPSHDCCDGSFARDTRCAVAEVPFMLCINVPGVPDGGKVVVLDYDVDMVNIPNYGCGCLIRSITEKDCISVKVKVVKPEIITIPKNCGGC